MSYPLSPEQFRKRLETAAADAAASSWDAHGQFVAAKDAYDFIYQLEEEADGDGSPLPDEMPAEWPALYDSACIVFARAEQSASAARVDAMIAAASAPLAGVLYGRN